LVCWSAPFIVASWQDLNNAIHPRQYSSLVDISYNQGAEEQATKRENDNSSRS
jgi:hypothetical protein